MLLTAIAQGNIAATVIHKILDKTQDINHLDIYGYTAFGLLCSQPVMSDSLQSGGYWGLILPMLKGGADPYTSRENTRDFPLKGHPVKRGELRFAESCSPEFFERTA